MQRLLFLYQAFATPITILSISFEAVFYCFFALCLLSWLILEQKLYGHDDDDDDDKGGERENLLSRKLKSSDLRVAVISVSYYLPSLRF